MEKSLLRVKWTNKSTKVESPCMKKMVRKERDALDVEFGIRDLTKAKGMY